MPKTQQQTILQLRAQLEGKIHEKVRPTYHIQRFQ